MRNVLVAIGNSGDATLAAEAVRLLADPSPLVRGAAVWALSRLLPPERLAALAAARRPQESEPLVEEEWTAALAGGRGLMPTLLCIGLGYCARPYVAEFGARFDRIVATTRSEERAAAPRPRIASAADRSRCCGSMPRRGNSPPPSRWRMRCSYRPRPADGRDPVLAAFADDDCAGAAAAIRGLPLDARRLR